MPLDFLPLATLIQSISKSQWTLGSQIILNRTVLIILTTVTLIPDDIIYTLDHCNQLLSVSSLAP